MLWKAADQAAPPAEHCTNFGWQKLENNICPVIATDPPAPQELMKVIACSCKSANPCNHNMCSCKAAQVSCTGYCKCQAGDICNNQHTVHASETDDDDNDDEDDVNDDGQECI